MSFLLWQSQATILCSSVVFGRHSMMKYLCCAFDCMVAFKRQIIFALVGHLYCLESSTVKQKHSSSIQVKVQHLTIYTVYSGINWPQVLCFFSPLGYKTVGSCLRGRFSLQVDIGLKFLFQFMKMYCFENLIFISQNALSFLREKKFQKIVQCSKELSPEQGGQTSKNDEPDVFISLMVVCIRDNCEARICSQLFSDCRKFFWIIKGTKPNLKPEVTL